METNGWELRKTSTDTDTGVSEFRSREILEILHAFCGVRTPAVQWGFLRCIRVTRAGPLHRRRRQAKSRSSCSEMFLNSFTIALPGKEGSMGIPEQSWRHTPTGALFLHRPRHPDFYWTRSDHTEISNSLLQILQRCLWICCGCWSILMASARMMLGSLVACTSSWAGWAVFLARSGNVHQVSTGSSTEGAVLIGPDFK